VGGREEEARIVGKYTAYWLAAQLSRRLPLSFAYWVGLRCADVFCRRDRVGRANVESNLRRIYAYRGIAAGSEFLARMERKTYQFFGKYLVDFFRYSVASCEEIKDRVTIAGWERFESAMERKRGVILVSAHLGNWELGGLVLSLRNYPLTTVYRPFGSPRLDRLFDDRRNARGFTTLPLGGAARGLTDALRRGETVALLADRDFSRQVEPAVFFGAPARLPRGPAVLAARTRACLVPTFLIRGVDDHYLLEFTSVIDPVEVRGVAALQRRIIEAMEYVIGAHPHQWFIFDDFWREQPRDREERT
jgi:KDO2-lipid IV(A) lauroyltransferase